tara:strand:+ start:2461 stop:2832 length:372 start_codon:yes stop_codon:yes gene_type:complete
MGESAERSSFESSTRRCFESSTTLESLLGKGPAEFLSVNPLNAVVRLVVPSVAVLGNDEAGAEFTDTASATTPGNGTREWNAAGGWCAGGCAGGCGGLGRKGGGGGGDGGGDGGSGGYGAWGR